MPSQSQGRRSICGFEVGLFICTRLDKLNLVVALALPERQSYFFFYTILSLWLKENVRKWGAPLLYSA